jgi:hypothetical protein
MQDLVRARLVVSIIVIIVVVALVGSHSLVSCAARRSFIRLFCFGAFALILPGPAGGFLRSAPTPAAATALRSHFWELTYLVLAVRCLTSDLHRGDLFADCNPFFADDCLIQVLWVSGRGRVWSRRWPLATDDIFCR